MSNQDIKQYLLKVQIFPTSRIDERSGVSQKTGKEWFIRTQEAYIDLGGQFPVMVKIPLQKDQVPYGVVIITFIQIHLKLVLFRFAGCRYCFSTC
ncbi:Helix-destabilising protein [Glaesserella parasuis]|uniref:G5P family DNA-binding protein n=1 Tax=Glaesserella parasuis TaxID=738 RepID=UPI000DFB10A9|nr:G5P family DNA-binding protein [Glaesserella parasuis]STP06387.1 Helix-destabilising protein [Glaesserella parasuis]